jgi:hypothetical protein
MYIAVMKKQLFTYLLILTALSVFAQHDVPPTSEFTVTGLVSRPLHFRLADLNRFHQDALGDLPIKNRRGEVKSTSRNLSGILLKSVLDSAGIVADKPKEYNDLIIVLTASDGYRNVFSWNELFNTEIGNHVYIITSMDGDSADKVQGRILVLSLADINSGSRHLKGLEKIEVKKI